MDPNVFLNRLQQSANYRNQIAHVAHQPARAPQYGEPKHKPSGMLWGKVEALGIKKLYAHQAAALDAIAEKKNVVLVTSTASGKTLSYNLPILDEMLVQPRSRAFYLFPTKALAQDQQGKLTELELFPHVRFATYDGDTPTRERPAIRKSAQIILTNPDMLHLGILPNHETWASFFRGLKFIVVDEIHVYRGVFGAHVGNILRRLKRIAEFHGASPQFICCSATIGNPKVLAETLTGVECEVIDNDGSPKGPRTFVMWNPPEIGMGERRSANSETTDLFASLVSEGVRNIAFTRARVTAELLLRYAKKSFDEQAPHLSRKIEAYRGGYTPQERREIEQRLFHGELLGVAATNALELGVDVGGLDAVLMNGYPGSIASLWQQAGRAGRAQDDSLAVMVAHNDPLEQYLVRHPETVLEKAHEEVRTNPANPYILASHLRCAAYERPLSPADLLRFGEDADLVVESLEKEELLQYRHGRWFYPFAQNPASQVDIRSASGEMYRIVDGRTQRMIGTMEGARAFQTLHEGAIYLHRGEPYQVVQLDLPGKQAFVEPTTSDYYTEAITETALEINAVVDERSLGEGSVAWGGVTVTEHVTGYRRRALFSEQIQGYETLDLPSRSFNTIAVWFRLPAPEDLENEEETLAIASGAHAIEHVSSALLPVLVSCDRNDLGSAWYSMHPHTLRPTVFVYDTMPGGVGLSEAAYERAREWLLAVRSAIAECDCLGGCPGCVYSPRCSMRNEAISKSDALDLLDRLLG